MLPVRFCSLIYTMDSPYFNPPSSHTRSRADSTFSITSSTDNSSVRKRSTSQSSRPRSISTAHIERYSGLLPEQIQNQLSLNPRPLSNGNWSQSHPSPITHILSPPIIQETAPTPISEQQATNLPKLSIDRRKDPIKANPSAEHKAKDLPHTSAPSMA